MRIVFAPDSYGGFLSAPAACATVAERLLGRGIRVDCHPMADGGEGTLEVLARSAGLERARKRITGPDGSKRTATWGWLPDGPVMVEVAEVVPLGRPPRVPMLLGSFGLGELLQHIAARRDGPVTVCLGGSATVDAGIGLAQGLGLVLLDGLGRPLPSPACAADLARIAHIVGPPPLPGRLVTALCDVTTPLADGVVRFGPQKGLPQQMVPTVSELWSWFADLLDTWRTEYGRPAVSRDLAGGGAAGGLGFALAALLDAPLLPGAVTVARMTGLDAALDGADVVVLGEGRMDPTSFQGKVAGEVLRRARGRGARVAALVGTAVDLPAAPDGPDVVFESGEATDEGFDAAVDQLGEWLAG